MDSKRDGFIQPSVTSQPPRLTALINSLFELDMRAVQMRTIIGGGNGGTNLGHLFQFAADQFSDAGALLSAQHIFVPPFSNLIIWGTRAMRRRQFYSVNGFVSENRATSNIFSKCRQVVNDQNTLDSNESYLLKQVESEIRFRVLQITSSNPKVKKLKASNTNPEFK
ncbi:hypothetical protein LXL04_007355 [Taraxacum kok-saghyz]